ncbi:hypothetical protein CGCF245_v013823 [Colletotrichum fructicola]|nr:hypothetical protein CGCF245_v013823 [Colletotrichum fructicola]
MDSMDMMQGMHIQSLAPSRKDIAAALGNCKGCSKPGLHAFTDGIPYECFLYEQLCTERQMEILASFTIHGVHNRLHTLNIRREKHSRVVIAIENCLRDNTIMPTSRAAALRTVNTRRKAIAHLEARIQ